MCWCLLVSLVFVHYIYCVVFIFFKQKTAYEMRISDWSSDVCSSDLLFTGDPAGIGPEIVAKVLADQEVLQAANLLIIGSRPVLEKEIGRASCRERVCQYV